MSRVFICADMEGVAGIVTRRQTDDLSSPDYARACELFSAEVKVCVEACLEAGCNEIVVADSHGSATNLDPREFPENVRLVQGWPRPLNMMEGIQEGHFDAAVLHGHHTAITAANGNFPHTVSSATYAAIRINDRPVSETQLNAWIAGHFGVPVVVATGDDAFARHAEEVIPGVRTVVTKRACGMYSADQLSPRRVATHIRQSILDALQNIKNHRPVAIETPVFLELDLSDRFFTHVLGYLPCFEVLGSHTIRTRCENIVEAIRIVGALPHLEASYH